MGWKEQLKTPVIFFSSVFYFLSFLFFSNVIILRQGNQVQFQMDVIETYHHESNLGQISKIEKAPQLDYWTPWVKYYHTARCIGDKKYKYMKYM